VVAHGALTICQNLHVDSQPVYLPLFIPLSPMATAKQDGLMQPLEAFPGDGTGASLYIKEHNE
jgi:hypothetical protein